jgi:hypothetical protein
MTERRSGGKRSGSAKGPQPPDDGDTYGGEPQGPGNPEANPVQIHRDYVERRVGGGERLTPEAYARVTRQWEALPGAIARPPVDLTGDEEPEPPTADGGGERPERPA